MNECGGLRTSSLSTADEIKQQLRMVHMMIKELSDSFQGLERKMDDRSDAIMSVEKAVKQLNDHHYTASRNDKGLFELIKTNAMQSNVGHMSLQKIEQGVNDLLAKGAPSGVQVPALTDAPPATPNAAQQELREELRQLQGSLTQELKALQTSLSQELLQAKAVFDQAPPNRAIPSYPTLPTPRDTARQQPSTQFELLLDEMKLFKAQQETMLCHIKLAEPANHVLPSETPTTADSHYSPPIRVVSSKTQVDKLEEKSRKGSSADCVKSPALEPKSRGDEEVIDHKNIKLRENVSLALCFKSDNQVDVPPYHVEDLYWKTGFFQRLARSNAFANVTVAVVIVNALYIGFDSDYNHAQNAYEAHPFFQAMSQFFCVYFTGELLCRFLAFEKKMTVFQDGWFKFDFFLVGTMILDIWIIMPVLYSIGGQVRIPTQPLRILRLLKLTRMARLMHSFPELVTMIKGLMRSLRAISSSMILIGLMVYVWAIVMHMLMKEEDHYNQAMWAEHNYSFDTITRCIWTLLMAGTLMLDSSSPLVASLLFDPRANFKLGGIMFTAYALISALCILQMLIGVLLDVVSSVKAEEQDAVAIGLLKQELLNKLSELDDGDGRISEEELQALISVPHSKALLKKMNVNHAFFVELIKSMYSKPGMLVPITSILELMVTCRGDNVSTVETMAGALVRIISEVTHVKQILEGDMRRMEKHLDDDINQMGKRIDHAELSMVSKSASPAAKNGLSVGGDAAAPNESVV